MKHVAAYMLATLGGVEQPTAADVKKILAAVGIQSEDARVEQLVAELTGKNVNDLVASGMSKLASMPAGVAVAAAPAAGAAPAAAAAAPKKVEKEESDEDMGMGLFD